MGFPLRERFDAWINAVTGLGFSAFDKTVSHQIAAPALLSRAQLEALFYGDDLAARIVEAPIDHATQLGFELAEDTDGALAEAAGSWSVLDKVRDAAVWGRLWGCGAILVGSRRGAMGEPLGDLGRGDLLYLTVLEAGDFHAHAYYDDPALPRWGEPSHYYVSRSFPGGQMLTGVVHESRLIRFGGVRTTRHYRDNNNGCDISVLQRVHEVLRLNDLSWKSLGYLIQDASQSVYAIKDLVDIIAGGHQRQLQQRMQAVDMSRSVARAILIDADTEDFKTVGSANVGSIAPAMQKIIERVAAAAQMPVTVLMGTAPGGLNSSGDAELRSWYSTLEVHRQALAKPLKTLLEIVAAHEGIKQTVAIEWPSFWSLDPLQEAQEKTAIANADKIYLDAGVVTPEEIATARWGRGAWSSETASAIDLEARQAVSIDDLLDPPQPTSPQVPPDAAITTQESPQEDPEEESEEA